MRPKQVEMDDVVRSIYHALESQRHLGSTLLVLCGDHGMNDAGNHGGTSEGETSPALVFISPKLRTIFDGLECPVVARTNAFNFYEKVEQTDIAPTLATLLGLPIPKNNLGNIIPAFLLFWSEGTSSSTFLRPAIALILTPLHSIGKRIGFMEQNAQQILGVLVETFPSSLFNKSHPPEACVDTSDEGVRLGCLWSRIRVQATEGTPFNVDIKEAMLRTFLRQAQNTMSNTSTNYSVRGLYGGITVAASVALWAAAVSAPVLVKQNMVGLWFTFTTLAYGAMMFASSYIEEEHQYWYWVTSAWLLWLGMRQYAQRTDSGNGRVSDDLWLILSAAYPLAIMRVIRVWNQTGQKHAGESDIAQNFLQHHTCGLWTLVCILYVAVAAKMLPSYQTLIGGPASLVSAVLLCTLGLAFKFAFSIVDSPELLNGLPIASGTVVTHFDLTTHARAVFTGIVAYCIGNSFPGQETSSHIRSNGEVLTKDEAVQIRTQETLAGRLNFLHGVLTLFLMTQSRVTNIPLFALFELQMRAFASMNLSPSEISLTAIMLQYASFFAFGGSNAISSIDLSNSYNGISGYNVAMVGVLTFCSNWAGPVWWTFASMILLVQRREKWYPPLREFRDLTTCFVAS
ncbi:MAG: hypothetical protein Q9197_006738, partial [Variospora fuerteventurae]